MDDYLSVSFRTLTRNGPKDGYEPLRWQRRLFEEYLSKNRVPRICDIPTGLGKTNVIHLWLLALRQQIREQKKERLPTRLAYVVDRRTVVDQATTLAERMKENLKILDSDGDGLRVSTLRGQLADNRDWTVDPSKPAIIIGTVDMIGSRLLFSGYRSSYKLRPLDAGLLGQDTLLVLDEAHLSEPFAKLIHELSDRGPFQRGQGKPMRVMCMSATSRRDDDDRFVPGAIARWENEGGPAAAGDDPDRFTLKASDLEGDPEMNPVRKRYEAKKRLTIQFVADTKTQQKSMVTAAAELAKDGSRVVVFVRRPDEAKAIEGAIRDKLKFPDAIAVLTGTMRGLERDKLVEEAILKRFLDGDEQPGPRPGKEPAVLVSTSAGEVGFDLNADHMVCDAAPLDSMIQRLGRVNRRGYGTATVRVFVAKPNDQRHKEGASEKEKHTFDSAAAETIKRLVEKSEADGTCDASPKAMDELKRNLTTEEFVKSCMPTPATVKLTDILLDAWSMTTIAKPMPGRPPVAEWLRGLAKEGPQTTIAWRAELDLEGFDQLDSDDIEEWFDAHPILPHETLSVPTGTAENRIRDRWHKLPDGLRETVGERLCVIDRAGLQTLKVKGLLEELEGRRSNSIRDAAMVLPASFGGIERGVGLLDESKPDVTAPGFFDAPDIADEGGRYRILSIVGDDSEPTPLIGTLPDDPSGFARFALDLPVVRESPRQLVSLVPKRLRRDFGTKRQPLSDHVSLVEKCARDICGKLVLSGDIRQAVELASTWHDRGKDRHIWQRAVNWKVGEEPWGKSGGSMRRIPGDYRHEFGSLCEFIEEYSGKLSEDVFELAMHLIAAHHGRARPFFPKGGFDPAPAARARSPEIAAEVIRRFARLQQKYGYWRLAWLENLLRCADAMASAENK